MAGHMNQSQDSRRTFVAGSVRNLSLFLNSDKQKVFVACMSVVF